MKKNSVRIPPQAFEQYTIAFYNLENLFDPGNVLDQSDEVQATFGTMQWTQNRYQRKLQKLSEAISQVGFQYTGKLPSLIGVAEVHNKKVLKDLITQEKLKGGYYDIIHHKGPDERGIDVALLYDTRVFKVQDSEPISIKIESENGVPESTRDILYVKGILAGTPIHIYVNHWPSRRDGVKVTEQKRIEVAQQLVEHLRVQDPDRKRVHSDLEVEAYHHVIIMGDFNDEPDNDSIKNVLIPEGFDNIIAPLKNYHRGSLNHQFKWSLFDQILISQSLYNKTSGSLYFYKAEIFDDIMLKQEKGKYRGQPARTFVGGKYKGGYSDHFPVYGIFRKN